jgi:putative peptide maturation dehydrogenase
MPRVRRTRYAFYYCEDRDFLDVDRLLRGDAVVEPLRQLVAVSILTGLEHAISRDELDVLLSVPSDDWVDASALGGPLDRLALAGLVVTDAADDVLRERDERLAAEGWNVYAALYHFMTKWRDVDDAARLELGAPAVGDEQAPSPFHSVPHDPSRLVSLPVSAIDGDLHDVLHRRATVREFDTTRSMSRDNLASLLGETFGRRDGVPTPSAAALRKTSPSGGGLHPTEVYPLIRDVEEVPPGLYHYSVEQHALEPMEQLPAQEVASLAETFAAGQSFVGQAHATFVFTVRFYRSFWKYRRHKRAYAVLLMDAGHLSQTFQLVCTALGLGAFVTAAINGANIEERLGLDPFREGALALCGCGMRSDPMEG